MTGPRDLDYARIAALIDGRLSEAEAAEVRAQIAASDDASLAAFADAVALSSELEAGAPTDATAPRVLPINRTSRWRGPALAAAAVVLLLVTATVVRQRSGSSASIADPGALALALDVGTSADSPAWDVTRGDGLVVSTRGRAIRTGALLVDIDVASRHPDSTSARLISRLGAVLEPITGGTAIAQGLSALGITDAQRRVLGDQAMRATGHSLASCGAWLEAARLALSRGDTAFVRRYPVEPVAKVLRSEGALDASESAMLARLASALRSGGAVDVASAKGAVDGLLRSLAR